MNQYMKKCGGGGGGENRGDNNLQSQHPSQGR